MSDHLCLKNFSSDFIKEHPSVKWVKLSLSTIRHMSNKYIEAKTGQEVTYQYEHTIKSGKRKGEVELKTEKSFVTHSYCPFCGKKYEEEQPEIKKEPA